jgi:hypothetical protein
MARPVSKRHMLVQSLGWGLTLAASRARAQDVLGRTGEAAPPNPSLRRAKTTKLFLSPPGWPNCITADPERGFWVQEQRHDNKQEAAWLLDPNGKLLKRVMTNCKNTSGMAYGDGYVWSGANGAKETAP